MSEFIQAALTTDPAATTIKVTPKISGTKVSLTLDPLPELTIKDSPSGSGWQKFNEKVSHHIIEIISAKLVSQYKSTLQTAAQNYLNDHASFTVPNIPVSVDGMTITLTPSNLASPVATADGEHIMIAGSVAIS